MNPDKECKDYCELEDDPDTKQNEKLEKWLRMLESCSEDEGDE